MKGTRPLDNREIRQVVECFCGTYEVRNRSLFVLGVSTGGRISELLGLKVGDVWQNNRAVSDLLFDKSIVKGKDVSRAVPLNVDGRDAIQKLIDWHKSKFNKIVQSRMLFVSRQGKGAMDRRTAHVILKTAFERAGLNGKLATHSLRKSFAQRLYEQTGDIFAVQELLGHKSVSTTQKYLGVNYACVRAAVENMAFGQNIKRVKVGSVNQVSDSVLIAELEDRGYEIIAHTSVATQV